VARSRFDALARSYAELHGEVARLAAENGRLTADPVDRYLADLEVDARRPRPEPHLLGTCPECAP
jgi:hypothetical protein